jgi:hypothetical protein
MQVDDSQPPPQRSPGPLLKLEPVFESQASLPHTLCLVQPSTTQDDMINELPDHELPLFDGEQKLDDILHLGQRLDTHSSVQSVEQLEDHKPNRAFLHERGIFVDNRFHLTICIDCTACFGCGDIYGHRRSRHCHTQADFDFLGRKEVVVDNLKSLGADRPYPLPSLLTQPIPILPVITAYRCGAPNCTDGRIFHSPKKVSEHCLHAHPDIPPRRRSHVSLQAQRIGQFRGRIHHIEVIHSSLQNVHPKMEDVLNYSKALGVGVKSETYQSASNVRAKNEFLSTTQWDSILRDVKLCQLRLAIGPPNLSSEPTLARLPQIVRNYYHNIAQRLESTLSTLTLRYIHSQDPEYASRVYLSLTC